MSIASKPSSLPSGALMQFYGELPDDWELVNGIRVDPAVYNALDSRWLPIPFFKGDSAIASPDGGGVGWLRDPLSNEHVYMFNGSSLRRHNLITGIGTACPTNGLTNPIPNAIAADEGLYFVQGTGVWLYQPATEVWSRLGSLPGNLSYSSIPLHDKRRNRLITVRAVNGTGNRTTIFDLATRTVTELDITHEFYPYSVVVLGDTLVGLARQGTGSFRLCTIDLETFAVTEPELPNTNYITGIVKINESLAFVSTSLSATGAHAALLSMTDAGPALHPLPIAGLEFLNSGNRLLPNYSCNVGPVFGNNLLIRVPLGSGGSGPVLALLSLSKLEAEIPKPSIFYARKL